MPPLRKPNSVRQRFQEAADLRAAEGSDFAQLLRSTPSLEDRRLVGYTPMRNQLFEPLREWVLKTRRSKGSKKLSSSVDLESARVSNKGGRLCWMGRDEIKSAAEPSSSAAEPSSSIGSTRSSRPSWLNIKQLTEPRVASASSSLQA